MHRLANALILLVPLALADQKNPPRLFVPGPLQERKLLSWVDPVYPEQADRLHVQGIVRLGVLISPEGDVERIQVISGHPLLVNAALDAVKPWRYEPLITKVNPPRC